MIALRPSEPDEATLVGRVRRGDEAALVLLMRKNNLRAFRVARTFIEGEEVFTRGANL